MAEKGHKTRLLEYTAQQRVPYLLFRLQDSVYGVHVRSVHEIVLLPELKTIAERAPYHIGVLNLRGAVVPVMDLELRFGRKSGVYSLTDYLLVLEHNNRFLGLVVHDVLGVERVKSEQFESVSLCTKAQVDTPCVDRLANIDEKIVMLLDLAGLFSSSDDWTTADNGNDTQSQSIISTSSPDDQALLRRRADQLRQSSIEHETADFLPVALAEIGGEYFAFELEFVKEFFETRTITPVPCCPPQILGNVNLRGDVLTVIDIRAQLNLPAISGAANGKIIVARMDDWIVGVLVDELHGVLYLPAAEITSVPSGAQTGDDASIKGTAPFRDSMMGIVDLPKLLKLENWVVDDEIRTI